MAAADEILGISGQMDISDIQKSFDALLGDLDKLGAKTGSLSARMTKALNEIAQSSDVNSKSTQQAFKELNAIITEAQEKLTATPKKIQNVSLELLNATKTLETLKEKLSKATAGTSEWETVNKMLENQGKTVERLKTQYTTLSDAFSDAQSAASVLNTAMDAINAARTISTAATGVSAVAHTGVSVAVGAEAVAHAQNAKEINQETDSIQKSVSSFKNYEDEIIAVKQRITELQQKIIETKESIQFDKNDVTFFKGEQDKASNRYGSMSNAAIDAGNLASNSQQRVDEQTKALQSYQLELQKAKLELSQLKDEQKLQNEASKAQSDEFTNIISKIEQWKSSLSDINALNQKFASQKEVIISVKESIDELGKSSQSNTEYARSLKNEIEEMSRKLRLSMVGDFDSNKAIEYYDKIKAKIAEYSEAVSYASGQSNAAIELQKEAIVGLETQLASLKEQLQAAQATNNTEAASAITTQIDSLNTALINAKNNLALLQTQADSATAALNEVANVEQQLNSGASRGSTLFGTIVDGATELKEKVSDVFDKVKTSVSEKIEAAKGKVIELRNSFTQNLSDISGRIGFDRLGEAFSSVGNRISELKDKFSNLATGGGKFQESLGNIKTALNGLPMPLGNVLGSVKAITSALWAMCATPIGAVLAAIAVGLQAVYQWFTKSADGQKAFTTITAYLGSLMSSLTDLIVVFGKYLYHAFADAKGPMHDFAKSFARTFTLAIKSAVSLLQGFGTTLKGIMTMDWDTFTDGLTKTWDGLKKAVQAGISGIETSIKATAGTLKTTYSMFTDKNFGKEMSEVLSGFLTKAENAAKLASQELKANVQLGKAKEKEAELEIKIATNREKIYTLTGKAKDAMIEETKILLKQKYDGQIKAQQQLWDIQKKRNNLHTTSLEDIKKERALHIDVLTTMAQQAASTRMLTRMQEANNRKMANEAKSAAKKDANQSKKEAKQQANITSLEDKFAEVTYKNTLSRIKSERALESEVTDARIEAMQEGAEKIIAERKRELEKEIEQIEEKKKAAIKAERDMQKAEFDAQQAIIKAQGGKVESWDETKHLDQKPIKEIEQKYTVIENMIVEKSNNQTLKEEIDKWNEFVEKYGSIQQQIYAITSEYEEKIKALRGSGDEIGASAAENELQSKLKDLQMQQVKDSIDWDSVFQDLESHSSKYLEKLRVKLKNLLSSGTLKIDDMKVVSEQITKVDEAISKQKSSWGIVNESVREHKRLIEEAKNAQLALNQAQSEQAKANLANTSTKLDIQATLAAIGVNAPLSGITYANKDTYISKVTNPEQQSALKKAFDELGITEVKLAKSTEEVAKAQERANVANDKAKNSTKKKASKIAGDLQGVLDKVQDLPNLLSSIGLGNSGFAKSVGNGINAVNNAKNAAADFASGNYIGAALNSVNAIKSFGKILGIGGGNGAEVAKRTKELTDSNQRLQYSIEQLKSSIDKSSGMKAVSNYQEAYKAQEAIIRQTMDILKTQMGYHGSHHSNAYYWDLSAEDYRSINKTLAQQSAIKGGYTGATINRVDSLEDLYKLTPEQMNDIRTYNQDIWKEMLEQGKYDKSEYWEKYTELAGKLEELTEQINQNLTQTSFDSMKDDFLSSLTDMSKSAQDFADDFTAMLNKSMLNFAISKLMDEKLKPLYEKWANKMKENGGRNLTSEEINNLKEEYQKIIDEGLKERDTIAAITGYDEAQSRQTATSKAINAITADQASALTGIGYAMQIALEHGNDTRTQISMDVSVMRGYAEAMAANMSEMRDIQNEGLGQLQQIVKNTAPIILIREDILSMYKLMKNRY